MWYSSLCFTHLLCFVRWGGWDRSIWKWGSVRHSAGHLLIWGKKLKLVCFICLCGMQQMDLNCALLQVCDSILNIGPCANASMGEPAFLSEEVHTVVSLHWFGQCFQAFRSVLRFLTLSYPQFQSNPEPDLEVVVCSGYGKNGALSVLQVNPPTGFLCCINVCMLGDNVLCYDTCLWYLHDKVTALSKYLWSWGPSATGQVIVRHKSLGLPGLPQRSTE